MDFRLDMYTLSDVFLNHAACTRRSSASSFWEVATWIWQPGRFSCSSSSGMGCLVSSFGRSNETIFAGGVDDGLNSLLLDSSESHSVSLLVESSSVVGSTTVSGFWSFWNRLMHMWVGCSLPHSLHHSGIFTSRLSTWLIQGLVSLLSGTPVNAQLVWGLVSL